MVLDEIDCRNNRLISINFLTCFYLFKLWLTLKNRKWNFFHYKKFNPKIKENLISFKKLKKSKNRDKTSLNEEFKIIKTNKLEINHQTINLKIKEYGDQLESRYKKPVVKQEQFEKSLIRKKKLVQRKN
ncbi:hypothetical protein A0H76_1683 [Hepatospora eriocheir]|uniref:Uncharacterized protein n=1 Tax=Hepatospora eriocheir TaxID=1081669 RepID=A0A1X0QGQ1_9MICR|nr:hypothetical protein A0H76_1683 [Hepatospora eriocheir]